MDEKIYLKEKDYPMPAKKIKVTDPEYLDVAELESYMRTVEVLKPWEVVEINTTEIGVPAFIISRVDEKKMSKQDKKDYKSRVGMFFNIIQYKFSCDIKNGKLGKNSLANFVTYIKDCYSYHYPFFILERLKKTDKALAAKYAVDFKTEITKLYDKKIAYDKKEAEKFEVEMKGTGAEKRGMLAKIK